MILLRHNALHHHINIIIKSTKIIIKAILFFFL
jgi:hypothetical protein